MNQLPNKFHGHFATPLVGQILEELPLQQAAREQTLSLCLMG